MPTPLRRWYRRNASVIVVLFVVGGLLTLIGYDAAVRTQQHQRQAATCQQIATLYDTIIRLVQADDQFTKADVATLSRQRDQRIDACRKAP
jgi:predicted negative regulator of RcsB-dependent stress response